MSHRTEVEVEVIQGFLVGDDWLYGRMTLNGVTGRVVASVVVMTRLAGSLGLILTGAVVALLASQLVDTSQAKPSLHARLVAACAPDPMADWQTGDGTGYIPRGVVVATCMGEDGPYLVGVAR